MNVDYTLIPDPMPVRVRCVELSKTIRMIEFNVYT